MAQLRRLTPAARMITEGAKTAMRKRPSSARRIFHRQTCLICRNAWPAFCRCAWMCPGQGTRIALPAHWCSTKKRRLRSATRQSKSGAENPKKIEPQRTRRNTEGGHHFKGPISAPPGLRVEARFSDDPISRSLFHVLRLLALAPWIIVVGKGHAVADRRMIGIPEHEKVIGIWIR